MIGARFLFGVRKANSGTMTGEGTWKTGFISSCDKNPWSLGKSKKRTCPSFL